MQIIAFGSDNNWIASVNNALQELLLGLVEWSGEASATPRTGEPAELGVLQLRGVLPKHSTVDVNSLRGVNVTISDELFGKSLGTIMSASYGSDSTWQLTIVLLGNSVNVEGEVKYEEFDSIDQFLSEYFLRAPGHNYLTNPLDTPEPYCPPPFEGNLWHYTQETLAQYGLELVSGATGPVFRGAGSSLADLSGRAGPWSVTLEDTEQVRKLVLWLYRFRQGYPNLSQFFPYNPAIAGHPEKSQGESPVLSVGANETAVVDIPLNGVATAFYQPFCVMEHTGITNRSEYIVTGSDNRKLTPRQWHGMGGAMLVEPVEGGRVARVTLVGPNIPHLAPFRIAESDGQKDYPSLKLLGTGSLWEVERHEFYSGCPTKGSEAEQEIELYTTQSQGIPPGIIQLVSARLAKMGGTRLSLSWQGSLVEGGQNPTSGYVADPSQKPHTVGVLPGVRFRWQDRMWRADNVKWSAEGLSITASPDWVLDQSLDLIAASPSATRKGVRLQDLSLVGTIPHQPNYYKE